MIGIIGAMDIEIAAIKNKISSPVLTKLAGCTFVCDKFDIDQIINIGVGCSLAEDIVVKNIVIADNVCQYDIDITALGEPRGFINGLNTIKIEADKEISDTLARIAINSGEKIRRGTIASGDTFAL